MKKTNVYVYTKSASKHSAVYTDMTLFYYEFYNEIHMP